MNGMPNIPNMPTGVTDALISFGGAALINSVFGNYWGIFSEFGIPLILADNVLEFEEKHGSRISKLPVEKGSFASYNKVSDPSELTITFSKSSGGSLERGAFLALLSSFEKSLAKVYVITPEKVYRNFNIVGHSQTRTADDGARLMKVTVNLEEVREVSVVLSSDETKNPEDSASVDTGEVE